MVMNKVEGRLGMKRPHGGQKSGKKPVRRILRANLLKLSAQ